MSDWIFKRGGRHKPIDWLAMDARFDSGLYAFWQTVRDRWTDAANFFDRFRLTGFPKLLNELTSELTTLGTGAIAVLLVLAQPALEATKREDWLSPGKYSVTFLDRDGNEVGRRGPWISNAVTIDEIPDIVVKAALATEDRRFFEHYGIDVLGTLRALVENLRANDVVQGGSSITQQLAKNLFLSSERSITRKIKEAYLALWLETHLTKKEILSLYLERAYMGGGAFGVEAASQHYFGKSVREVTLAEAAMLAGLFKAPTKYSPYVDLAASRARADEVLTNMVQAGFMTEGQVHGARLNPAMPIEAASGASPDWFLDYAYEEAQRLLQGRNDYVVTARTTLDSSIQRVADTTIATALTEQGPAWGAKQAAMVTMEPGGAIRAIVGGRDYGENSFNRATQAKRQPGSSFKPYVYLTALENGYKPTSTVNDAPVVCGRWSPKNYSGGYSGRMPMANALARSINTVAVFLSLKVGREKVLETLDRLGIHGVKKSCSMALGDQGISLVEHTGGYAVFANDGKRIPPFTITEIFNARGDVIYDHDRDAPAPVQVFDPKAIENLNYMLNMVITEGTGKAAQLDFTAVAGKTGTTSGHKDVWFMGYTGQYVAGIWLGNDNLKPMRGLTGGHGPAPIWKTFMTAIHTSPNIPLIPGVAPHPAQLAALEQAAAAGATVPAPEEDRARISERTADLLKALAEEMRSAAGPAGAEDKPGRRASTAPSPAGSG